MNLNVTCPKCGKQFRPYGPFMLETCHCPYCGYKFTIIKGVGIIRVLYMLLTFSVLMVAYTTIRPQTSIIIAVFWLSAMLVLKAGTYAMHIILFITWKLFSALKKVIFKQA